MAESLHMDYIRDDGIEISPEVMELVPESLAASCNIFPLNIKHNVLYLAMENPLDIGVIQLVEFSTGMKVEPLLAAPSQLAKMIRQHYNIQPSVSN
jgi:type IV pilus assembly protein PilB